MWETAKWECAPLLRGFLRSYVRVFDSVKPEREASHHLLSLTQEAHSVTQYAIEFLTLASDSSWNESAWYNAFYHRLSEHIKDELAARDLPKTLNNLIELSTQIYRRIRERPARTFFLSSPGGHFRTHAAGQSQLSRKERDCRFRVNFCLYCEGPGHHIQSCPLKGMVQQEHGDHC